MTTIERIGLAAVAAALALSLTALVAAGEPAPAVPPPAAAPSDDAATHVVRVYYFRTTARCVSCKKIEAFTDSAIRTAFAREIEIGKLAWQVINVQEPENGHFIRDYKLATKSVVVVDTVDGGQVRWKNLSRVWELLGDEAAFARYVQEEVRQYLEKRS